MDTSAIILTGAQPNKADQDIGTLELSNKPLVVHVVDTVKTLVDEIIIVTDSKTRVDIYSKIVGADIKIIDDPETAQSDLLGALLGFQKAQGKFSLLVPFSAPFLSFEVIKLLIELCPGRSAVIPRWSSAQIETLPTVYQTQSALEAANRAVEDNKNDLEGLIENLRGVRYISTLVLQELDPELKTFFRVRTPIELKKAAVLANPKPNKSKR